MGRGIEVNQEREMAIGFVRLNSQNYCKLERLTVDGFFFPCKTEINVMCEELGKRG